MSRSRQLFHAGCAILKPVIGMVIYLDVLLLSNLWADYALLHAVAALTHHPLKRGRCLLAAALGAVSALVILLPPMPAAVSLLMRLLLALAMCAAAFGIRPLRLLLRQTVLLLSVSMGFCGAVYLLSQFWQPVGFYMQNTAVYADVSLLTLLIGTAAASAWSAYRARARIRQQSRNFRLRLQIQGICISLPALADTGNTLRDAFTGKPVAVCTANALSAWLRGYPDAVTAAASCKGFRMQPVQTVTGRRLLPLFQPDSVTLCRADAPSAAFPVDLLIAISEDPGITSPAIVPAYVIS